MGRLIDIYELQGCAIIRPETHEEMEHIRACKNLISHDDIPTVDAVEVVRCKDCKHYVETALKSYNGCEIFNGAYETSLYPTDPDDYCSYGERREDG